MTEIIAGFPVQNLKINTLCSILLNKILLSSSYRDTQDSDTEDDSSINESASDQNLFISMSESDSEKSDIAMAKPKKKKKKIEEESGSESEGINIKLETFLPSTGIRETIVSSDDKSEDESKSIIKKFVPVKQVDSDLWWVTKVFT